MEKVFAEPYTTGILVVNNSPLDWIIETNNLIKILSGLDLRGGGSIFISIDILTQASICRLLFLLITSFRKETKFQIIMQIIKKTGRSPLLARNKISKM
jgi:hypothetical protein